MGMADDLEAAPPPRSMDDLLKSCDSAQSAVAAAALTKLRQHDAGALVPHVPKFVARLSSPLADVQRAAAILCEYIVCEQAACFVPHANQFIMQLEQIAQWDEGTRRAVVQVLRQLVLSPNVVGLATTELALPFPPGTSAKVVHYVKTGDHVDYHISVCVGSEAPYAVPRRYSAFRELHAALEAEAQFRLPPSLKLPPKRLIVNDAVCRERAKLLTDYLSAVLLACCGGNPSQRLVHAAPPPLLQFLDVQSYGLWADGGGCSSSCPNTAPAPASEPGSRAELAGSRAELAASRRASKASRVTSADLGGGDAVLRDAPALDGGMQGFSSQPLIMDDDGDEAHEFLTLG